MCIRDRPPPKHLLEGSAEETGEEEATTAPPNNNDTTDPLPSIYLRAPLKILAMKSPGRPGKLRTSITKCGTI